MERGGQVQSSAGDVFLYRVGDKQYCMEGSRGQVTFRADSEIPQRYIGRVNPGHLVFYQIGAGQTISFRLDDDQVFGKVIERRMASISGVN